MSDRVEPKCPKCGGLIAFVTEAPDDTRRDEADPSRTGSPDRRRPTTKRCECSPPIP